MILQIIMYLAIAFVITFAVKYVFTELLSAKLPKERSSTDTLKT